ncbi:MAG: gamma-glutamylcyclotransferase [Pseudomonadales bacterium]|nr:gamma-glutamylcyclotransferase [Pseudomonadales bacterium]
MDFYFAYGSNMNPARVIARRMQFDEHFGGELDGYTLRFNKRSVAYPGAASANIVEAAGSVVEGVLYRLSAPEQIETMDPYEGYPVRYSRVLRAVRTSSGDVDAWVYIANPEFIEEGLKPLEWYLAHLLAGKPHLSEGYFRRLEATPCIPDTSVEPA